MTTADRTADQPFGAWLFAVEGFEVDLDRTLEQYGQVFRLPLSAARAMDLAPGDRAVLARTDRSRVVGVWALGEVVAPALIVPPDTPQLPAEPAGTDEAMSRTYAEVELYPLAKPLAVDALLADPVLATSPLAELDRAHAGAGGPVALSADERRAIESLEFWLEEPSDEQAAAFEALLARDDAALEALDDEITEAVRALLVGEDEIDGP